MELNEWFVLAVLTLVGIFALVFASNATGGMVASIGVLIAVAAVVAIFYRVKQYFDRVDASHH